MRIARYTLIALLILAAPAHAASYRGAMIHALWTWQYSETDSLRDLDALQAVGGNVVRVGLRWEDIQPTDAPPQVTPTVERLDRFIAAAQARHISVVLLLAGSPCWAADLPAEVPCDQAWHYPPKDPARFGEAAAWAAARWQGQIIALEIWNEPNIDAFLTAPDKAQTYADLLKATYPRVKAVAPSLTVLGGALSLVDLPFMRSLYADGAQFDAVSVHPYIGAVDPTGGLLASQLNGLHDLLAQHGDGDVWVTEFGWDTNSLSPDRQAAYLASGFRILDGLPFVRASIMYLLRDTSVGDPIQDHYGLLTSDFQPKPSYAAVQSYLRPSIPQPTATPATPGSVVPAAHVATVPPAVARTVKPSCGFRGRRIVKHGMSCRHARRVIRRWVDRRRTRGQWRCHRVSCHRPGERVRLASAHHTRAGR